jgi:hypothetical protein
MYVDKKGTKERPANQLETTTTTTTLSTGAISRDRSSVFDTTNAHTGTGKSTESGLTTGTRGLDTGTTSSTDLDVESVDTEFLALGSNILSSQHGGVRGRFITISLDLHTTSNTGDGFTTRKIGHMHKGVVEGGKDVSNTENELTFTDLGTEGNLLNRSFSDLRSLLGLLSVNDD